MNSGIRAVMRWDERLRSLFGGLGAFLPGMCLRLLLAAGIFSSSQGFAPLHAGSASGVSGGWVTAATMAGAVLLLLGLATRYVAVLFLLSGLSALWPLLTAGTQALTLVGAGAMSGHDGSVAGLVVAQAALLLVLVGCGPGTLSLDHLVARRHGLV